MGETNTRLNGKDEHLANMSDNVNVADALAQSSDAFESYCIDGANTEKILEILTRFALASSWRSYIQDNTSFSLELLI